MHELLKETINHGLLRKKLTVETKTTFVAGFKHVKF